MKRLWTTLCLTFWLIVGVSNAPAIEAGELSLPEIDGIAPFDGVKYSLSIEESATGGSTEPACLTAKVGLTAERMDLPEARDVFLWWTTPTGIKTTLRLGSVDSGLWAGRIASDLEPGKHQLTLVVMFEAQSVESEPTYREAYTLESPQMILTKDASAGLSSGDGRVELPAPGMGPKLEKAQRAASPISIPLIAVQVLMLNVALLMVVGAAYVVRSKLPPNIRRRLEGTSQDALPFDAVRGIFKESGMLAGVEAGGPAARTGARGSGSAAYLENTQIIDSIDDAQPQSPEGDAPETDSDAAAGGEDPGAPTPGTPEPAASAANEEIREVLKDPSF